MPGKLSSDLVAQSNPRNQGVLGTGGGASQKDAPKRFHWLRSATRPTKFTGSSAVPATALAAGDRAEGWKMVNISMTSA